MAFENDKKNNHFQDNAEFQTIVTLLVLAIYNLFVCCFKLMLSLQILFYTLIQLRR